MIVIVVLVSITLDLRVTTSGCVVCEVEPIVVLNRDCTRYVF